MIVEGEERFLDAVHAPIGDDEDGEEVGVKPEQKIELHDGEDREERDEDTMSTLPFRNLQDSEDHIPASCEYGGPEDHRTEWSE